MKTLKKPLSIKIIYWITNITYWIYVAVSVAALFLIGVLMYGGLDDLQLNVGIPVAVNVIEEGTLDLNLSSTIINVEFAEMYGKIHFIDTPAFIGRIFAVFMFIILLIMFYIFYTFRKFINNVYVGKYFDFDNIALLKRISYALVVTWIFTAIYAYFQYFFIVVNLNFNSLDITSNVQTYPIILLIALFIWVLSHIFMKGCELEDETNLTI
jgi:hypothetical protein